MLANYYNPISPNSRGKEKPRIESYSTIGKRILGVNFLDGALAAAATVGRVLNNASGWRGTGFKIFENLFMTCNHVMMNPAKAKDFFVEFNYELDAIGVPKAVTRFALAPDSFFFGSPEKDLDFTIVALGNRIVGEGNLSDFGYCPISKEHSLSNCKWANIIHHPLGDFKQIILSQNQIVARNADVLHYYAATEVGSSGAPVFNDEWEPIALHHWGVPTRRDANTKGKSGPRAPREGIRVASIVDRVVMEKNYFDEAQQALIDAALGCPFKHPSLLKIKCR